MSTGEPIDTLTNELREAEVALRNSPLKICGKILLSVDHENDTRDIWLSWEKVDNDWSFVIRLRNQEHMLLRASRTMRILAGLALRGIT